MLYLEIYVILTSSPHNKHGHTDQNKQIYSSYLALITSLDLVEVVYATYHT